MIELLLPFHGDPALFRETVMSVRAQSLEDWRMLVIDDHYPDPSPGGWLQDLNDGRIRYLRSATNKGANRTYQDLLDLSEAEYLVFVGADDRLLPNYLERMTAVIAERARPHVIQPGVQVIDAVGRTALPLADLIKRFLRNRITNRESPQKLVSSLLMGNWTYFPSLVWHGDTVRRIGFRPYNVVQDLALLLDVLLDGGTLYVDDVITFQYRRHSGSDSAVRALRGTRFREEREYLAIMRRELRGFGWDGSARAARARLTSRANALSFLPKAAMNGDIGSCARLIEHAFGP